MEGNEESIRSVDIREIGRDIIKGNRVDNTPNKEENNKGNIGNFVNYILAKFSGKLI